MQYLLELTTLEAERLMDALRDTRSGFHPAGSLVHVNEEENLLLRGESIQTHVEAANEYARLNVLHPLLAVPDEMDLEATAEMLELLSENFHWRGGEAVEGPNEPEDWAQLLEDHPRAAGTAPPEDQPDGMLEPPPRPTGERIIAAAAGLMAKWESDRPMDPVRFTGHAAAQTARIPEIARALHECRQDYNPSHVIDGMLWTEAQGIAAELIQHLGDEEIEAIRRIAAQG